jgi:hypothetical protein
MVPGLTNRMNRNYEPLRITGRCTTFVVHSARGE